MKYITILSILVNIVFIELRVLLKIMRNATLVNERGMLDDGRTSLGNKSVIARIILASQFIQSKKKVKITLQNTIILLSLFFISCSTNVNRTDININPFYWKGTYISIENWNNGYIKETRLTLKVDSTFELFMEYRGTSEPNIYRKSGKFKIDNENIVNLYGLVSKDRLYETFYIIESDSIITNYDGQQKLKKAYNTQLTNDKWDLYSLDVGKVGPAHDLKLNLPYLKFENDGNVRGKTSCNNFKGRFDVIEDGFVTISDLIITKMACRDSEFERKYLEVLSQKFRYTIRQDSLEFMDGYDKVIAKFIRY